MSLLWRQFVCEKREMLTNNFEVFFLAGKPPPNKLQLQNSLEYSLFRVLKMFTVLYYLALSCFCALFSVNFKLQAFWTGKKSDPPATCTLTPAKIKVVTKIIFKNILGLIGISILSGKLSDF